MEIRERIIEGAANLFKTYGIKTVTMDSLAAQLGISKRTIYEVFSDKDELLVKVLEWMAERQRVLVGRILDESENAIIAIFRLLETNRDHFQNMSPAFQADLKKYHYEALISKNDKGLMPDYRNNIAVIERGIRENLFRKDINPDIVNRCLYSLGRSTMDFDLYPFEDFTRREVIKNVFITYMKGIATIKGIELINKLEAKF
ncbi:MAG: TetR/AcrR family transcriptional regulator [Bacteroidales bacterium]|nr:TetR/AcrR family transcriptional regulator [Bacteroidales bacterium]MBK8880920.1 TetR/AcrR family transcriptional regulator [Bacteroidales bacterium]